MRNMPTLCNVALAIALVAGCATTPMTQEPQQADCNFGCQLAGGVAEMLVSAVFYAVSSRNEKKHDFGAAASYTPPPTYRAEPPKQVRPRREHKDQKDHKKKHKKGGTE